MNILTTQESRLRDQAFDRDDAARHRETCSPAGMCCQRSNGTRVYCSIHDPEPWLYRVQLDDEIIPFKTLALATAWADQALGFGRQVICMYRADVAGPLRNQFTDAAVTG
jgi:hypothetical protein